MIDNMVSSRAASLFFRPAEWGRHSRCILAWPGLNNCAFETTASLDAATNEVSNIARTIAKFEPVTLAVGQERLDRARTEFELRSSAQKHEIRICPIPGDDLNLWMRDIAPTFTLNQRRRLSGTDFNFNGWGARHATEATTTLARKLLQNMKVDRIETRITTEGGAIEIDGEGTLLATESSIINENRNPGKSKLEIEQELRRCLGVSKIIWVPGVRNADSTDCHIDALARFARPGVLFISRPVGLKAETVWMEVYEETKEILSNECDARGRNFKIIDMPEPDMALLNLDEKYMKAVMYPSDWSPVATYVNYYLPNGGLLVPKFGDVEADANALDILKNFFQKEREVVQVYINALPLQGGGIHCATQEVPWSAPS